MTIQVKLPAKIPVTTAVVLMVCGTAALMTIRNKRKKKKDPALIVTETTTEFMVQNLTLKQNEMLREPVSEVDQWLAKSNHWLPFCIRFDSLLDAEQVRLGLERTLVHVPALGARFDTTNKFMYELVLSSEQNGVPLEIMQGTAWKGTKLPDESVARTEWQKAGLDAPPPGFNGAPGMNDPLMRARLILFEAEKVSYLSIGISHGLGDGHSFADILQIWSHFCTSPDPDQLPEPLATPRTFGRRVTQPLHPAKTKAELEERVLSDVGYSVNPLSAWAFFGHVLPRALWSISRQRIVEVRIHGDRMAALKKSLDMPKGEWVSRFELVCAALMLAQRATSESTADNHDHKLFVACDLRGRIDRFPKDYFGNAAFDFCEPISLPTNVSWNPATLVHFVREIHRGLRHGLEKPEDIIIQKDWFEAARHLGITNHYDVWPIVLDTFKGTGTFVNSWGPRWLDISMGASSKKARCMVAYFGTAENLLVEVPRTRESGDTTIQLALPAHHAKKFVSFCKESAVPLPFTIVT